MHGLRLGLAAGLHDPVDHQIAFGRGWRPDRHRLIGHLDMECVAVSLGIYRYRGNSHAAGGLDDATGDLAAICDQDFFEHLFDWRTLGGFLFRNLARGGGRNNSVLQQNRTEAMADSPQSGPTRRESDRGAGAPVRTGIIRPDPTVPDDASARSCFPA